MNKTAAQQPVDGSDTASLPSVSIVIPVHDDEAWIATALESCSNQTLDRIEIICVDDASTDATCEVIAGCQERDARIRLIRQDRNLSAFQARRVGVHAAAAPHVLFLDGDDELDIHAAERSLAVAKSTDADLVGFGVTVILPHGQPVGGYQSRLQPAHESLDGDEVLSGLFPAGEPAQGQLWRYLFRTSLLRTAYAALPSDLVLPRINDLPITFLAAAAAERFVSIPDQLYKYHFRRGGSGHQVSDLSQFEFYLAAIDSVDSMESAVRSIARTSPNPEPLLDGYESARLSIIANVLNSWRKIGSTDLRTDALARLHERVSETDVVLAAAAFCRSALQPLAQRGRRIEPGDRPVRSVLLTTNTVRTGGVSGVLLSQARFLLDSGYRVTIAARGINDPDDLPEGAKFVEVTGGPVTTRLAHWAEICRDESIDVIIDHHILYNRDWPAYALTARALGVPTIGWIHNFAARPIYDLTDLSSFLKNHLDALATLVTLSPLDVAFWKLRGIAHTAYLPNPPSPMLIESSANAVSKPAPQGRIEVIWWGRLEQHTKQVRQLLDVAAQLRELAVDFRLQIIGPDWGDLSAEKLTAEAEKRGLDGHVEVVGPLLGQDLLDAIDAADVFVSTSVIEGYPLTLPEAQARGLPVVMYELPWLALVQDNAGVVAVPQGDAAALAQQVAAICEDSDQYSRLSKASIEAAQRALSCDFRQLYEQLITGTLPAEFSPEPTLADAQQLIDLVVFFAERNARRPDSRRRRKRGGAQGRSIRHRMVRRATPLAHRAIRVAPGLKPFALRVRRTVLGG